MTKLEFIILEIHREVERASALHAPMVNNHEGYAVILEELDELWDEIKAHKSNERTPKMRKEAIQVAAMAIRFIHDLFAVKE